MPILNPNRICADVIVFAFAGLALARRAPAPVEMALQRAEIPPYAVGIHVQEAGGRAVLAAASWNAPFNPRSTMKLVATGAALARLGPACTWKTEAFADGPQAGDVLRGDLVIRGSGDPRLLVEDLWQFLRRIRAR